MGLPSSVRGLLAARLGEPTDADARWPLFVTLKDNRDRAFWLAMEQARDPRVRWAALEVQMTPEAGAADPASGGGHVWLGLVEMGADGGAGAGSRSGGVLEPSGTGLWMGSSSDGPLPGAVLVDLLQQGRVTESPAGGGVVGSGTGSGAGRRLEKALQLPAGGGRAGVLWDLYGGTLLAVVNGETHGPEGVTIHDAQVCDKSTVSSATSRVGRSAPTSRQHAAPP